VINVFGWCDWCITLVLARIIITVTQTVRIARVKDIVSDAINSVIIEYEKLLIKIGHRVNMNSVRIRAVIHM